MSKITRFADIEVRKKQDSNEVEGIACVFNQRTDMGWFTEEIDRHAFDDCNMDNVVLNFNHDDSILLAGTRNGSLALEITDAGLKQRASIIDTTQGRDVLKLVQEGLIDKMSFAFTVRADGEEWISEGDHEHRIIRKIDRLFDVSLVTFPAYEQTSVFARGEDMNDDLAIKHKAQLEQRKDTMEEIKEIVEQEEAIEEKAEEMAEITPEAEAPVEEVKEETIEEIEEKEEEREMEKDLTLDATVSTENVEARKEIQEKESRDSKDAIKEFRNWVMAGRDQRAGVKSTDTGVPVPTLFQSLVETAWEKVDIIDEVTKRNIKGIFKVPYEVSSTGAAYHAEGADAVSEESLVLGETTLICRMIKKWISVTDELEALTDDQFMKYIADEVVYQVIKFLQDKILVGAGQGTGSNEGVIGIENASLTESITTALSFNAGNDALAVVDGGDAPLMVVNRTTFFKNIMGLTDLNGRPIYQIAQDNAGKPQYFVNGIRVKFSNALPAYDSADAGDTWAIVGDFKAYTLNLPEGNNVITLYDPYTLATQDKSRMIGRIFASGNVTKPEKLAKLVVPSAD